MCEDGRPVSDPAHRTGYGIPTTDSALRRLEPEALTTGFGFVAIGVIIGPADGDGAARIVRAQAVRLDAARAARSFHRGGLPAPTKVALAHDSAARSRAIAHESEGVRLVPFLRLVVT